jgi:hypothetical protein
LTADAWEILTSTSYDMATLNDDVAFAANARSHWYAVRILSFTMGHYGVFHIWHREADLYLLDLANGQVRAMDEINSPETESYHAWSSNGRWVVFSSRRDDGSYTRPFFTHIDADGKGSKPFELPQADPDYHRQFLKCYNIPEFMRGPVEVTPQAFASVLKASDGTPVKYVPSLR